MFVKILSFLDFPGGISEWESTCWCWCWNSNSLATWCEGLTHWKRPWCLRAGGEGGNRGWDGWMASMIQWTWLWANSGIQWRTGKSGVLQSMGLQRARQDWGTEQKQQQLQGEACIRKWRVAPDHCNWRESPPAATKTECSQNCLKIFLNQMFCRIHRWNYLFCVERFLITDSTSFLVTGLFRLFIFSFQVIQFVGVYFFIV